MYIYDVNGHRVMKKQHLQREIIKEFNYMETNTNTDYLLIPAKEVLRAGLGSQKTPANKYCLNSNLDFRKGRSYKTNEWGQC